MRPRDLVALRHVGSSQTRGRTHVCCFGEWTTREVPSFYFNQASVSNIWVNPPTDQTYCVSRTVPSSPVETQPPDPSSYVFSSGLSFPRHCRNHFLCTVNHWPSSCPTGGEPRATMRNRRMNGALPSWEQVPNLELWHSHTAPRRSVQKLAPCWRVARKRGTRACSRR